MFYSAATDIGKLTKAEQRQPTKLPRRNLISNTFTDHIVTKCLSTKCADNDNEHDHSICQLSVHKALTCSEGQECVGLGPSLVGEKKLVPYSGCSCSDLPPLRMKWNLCAVFGGGLLAVVVLVFRRFTCRLIGREGEVCRLLAAPSSCSWLWSWLRVCSLSDCCCFGCRCRSRQSYWLFEFAACKVAFHGVQSHFKSSCTVVTQVVSFVRSLLSLLVLVVEKKEVERKCRVQIVVQRHSGTYLKKKQANTDT